MTDVPTLDEVRQWTGVPATSVSDAALQLVLDAETEAQALVCTVVPFTAGLHQAILRRCARHLAARNVPLGMTSDGEMGTAQLSTWDAEIERLERPLRMQVVG